VNLQFPDRDYFASQDDRQYRRGVYAHWQRTFLQPMLANFDAPSREECTALRPVSNTPQQALTLLNDPSFVEAARVFAQKLLASPAKTDEARLNFAYQRALGRSAKPPELASLKKFLTTQREHLQTDTDEAVKLQKVGLAATPKDANAAELAAWTSVCRVVLNLHETISIY
jgi:predicted metal-dependent HD superfamily phosphohydrolase